MVSQRATGGDPSKAPDGRRRPGRWRTGLQNRQRILDAARSRFARHGYDGTTVRAIAADAGVDPAIVYYFFGSKPRLFAEVIKLPGSPRESVTSLLETGLGDLGARYVRRFLEVWDAAEDFEPLLALVRSTSAHDESASLLRTFIEREVSDRFVAALDTPDSRLRVALVHSLLMGVAVARYLARLEPIASASHDALVAWLGPIVQQCLTGPAPDAGASQHTRQPTRVRSTEGRTSRSPRARSPRSGT